MRNHEFIPDWDEADGCPVHSGEVKKAYDFGLREAEVVVFTACRCAVCVNHDGSDSKTAVTYHTAYNSASGRARLVVESAKAANAPFC